MSAAFTEVLDDLQEFTATDPMLVDACLKGVLTFTDAEDGVRASDEVATEHVNRLLKRMEDQDLGAFYEVQALLTATRDRSWSTRA